MSLQISTETLEYLFVPVTVDDATPNAALPVEMAFPDEGVNPSTWITAAWDTGRARVLVGTGGDVALAAGRYDVWVKITSTPEIPARRAGFLIVR